MAAGLPVVASAVGAIPDFVKDGEDGCLVPARDPSALAAAINRLLDDEELRRRIATRVRDRALREFTIEAGCSRVGEILRGSLAPQVPTPSTHDRATREGAGESA
jgi:glycosyltransferase involved in cell wall biosynthesis